MPWRALQQALPLAFSSGSSSASWVRVALAVRLGISVRPAGVSWLGLYGASLLTGIGFTMSLFIGTLARENGQHAAELRFGVILGSIAPAALGMVILAAEGLRRQASV
jgi:Na+:H+ antiporter, NhaA family